MRAATRRGSAALLAALVSLAAREAAATTCSFTSAVGVKFGVYSSAFPLQSTGSIVYKCNGAIQNTAVVGIAAGSSATFAFRTLKSGVNSLRYNLYTDAARTTIWGDGTAGTGTVNTTSGNGVTVTLTVYGLIPAAQHVPLGSYADTVTILVNF